MSKITTADCRAFLVSRVAEDIMPATSWAYDIDSAWDSIVDEMGDAFDEHDPAQIAMAAANQDDLRAKVLAALSRASNWKRRSKVRGDGDIAVVREFMCDTPDNMFDGQVGYEVLERRDGTLELGQYVGD